MNQNIFDLYNYTERNIRRHGESGKCISFKYYIESQKRINEIIAHSDYHPGQWLTELHDYTKRQLWESWPKAVLRQLTYSLDSNQYEIFPTEWWLMVHELLPGHVLNLSESKSEFLNNVVLLSELEEK